MSLSIINLTKSYQKNNQVLKNLNLEIFDQEFITILGPSGCGKSTLLRVVAGLEEIDQGRILINQQLANQKTPSQRNLNMVFQNYALLPNLTVFKNLEFGLLDLKLSKLKRYQKIEETAKTLQLFDKLGSFPHQLSGGQRQRVALGRALIDGKKILLLDEPLSNLDANLRNQMRIELIKFRKEYQVTSIFVTHDQEEALSTSTRIVVLDQGIIQMIGTPHQLYTYPSNLFVARFIGSVLINEIDFDVVDKKLINPNLIHPVSAKLAKQIKGHQKITYCIRPNDVLVSYTAKKGYLKACLNYYEYLGNKVVLHLMINDLNIRAITNQLPENLNSIYINISNNYLLFDQNQQAINDLVYNQVLFDFPVDENIKREIINYGYQLTEQLSDKTLYIKKINNQYLITNLNVTLDDIKDLFKYLIYIPKGDQKR